MEAEASLLKAMGLNDKRLGVDEHLGFSKWTQKLDLHTRVKAQTGTVDKPESDVWFRHEKGTNNTDAARCNVSLYIIKFKLQSQKVVKMTRIRIFLMNIISAKLRLVHGQ